MGGGSKSGTAVQNEFWVSSIKIYLSCVDTLNHYSTLVYTVRITALTSGIAILAVAGGLAIRNEKFPECCYVCIFGLIFSFVLFLMTHNIYQHYTAWLELAADQEDRLRLPQFERLWTRYKEHREERGHLYQFVVHYGCIIMIMIASFLVLLWSLWHCFQS